MRVIDYYVREDEADIVLEIARGRDLQTVRADTGSDLHHVRVSVPFGPPDDLIQEIDEKIDFESDPGTFFVVSEALTIRPRRWKRQPDERMASRDEIETLGEEGMRAGRTFWVLAVASGLLASAGLLTDNAAVIVGAMVIAPLYPPIAGVTAGVILGRGRMMWKSTLVLMLALLVALACGVGVSLGMSGMELNQSMQIRGAASFFNVVIALAAGASAGYTVLRNDRVLVVGIVVAASLVPQSAATGLFIGQREWGLALGGVLALATNVVGIGAAMVAICHWERLRPQHRAKRVVARAMTRWMLAGLAAGVVVLSAVTIWARDANVGGTEVARPVSQMREHVQGMPGVTATAYVSEGDLLFVLVEGDPDAIDEEEVRRVATESLGRPVHVAIVAADAVPER